MLKITNFLVLNSNMPSNILQQEDVFFSFWEINHKTMHSYKIWKREQYQIAHLRGKRYIIKDINSLYSQYHYIYDFCDSSKHYLHFIIVPNSVRQVLQCRWSYFKYSYLGAIAESNSINGFIDNYISYNNVNMNDEFQKIHKINFNDILERVNSQVLLLTLVLFS